MYLIDFDSICIETKNYSVIKKGVPRCLKVKMSFFLVHLDVNYIFKQKLGDQLFDFQNLFDRL